MFSVLLDCFIGACFGFQGAIQPGPLTAILVSESIRRGPRAGMKIGIIPLITDPPVLFLALLIVAGLPDFVLGLISVAGAILLCRLGWLGLKKNESEGRFDVAPVNSKTFRAAILLNFLNPNLYVYSFTINAPQMVSCWKSGFFCSVGYIVSFFAAIALTNSILAILSGFFKKKASVSFLLRVNRVLSSFLFIMAALFLLRGIRYFF